MHPASLLESEVPTQPKFFCSAIVEQPSRDVVFRSAELDSRGMHYYSEWKEDTAGEYDLLDFLLFQGQARSEKFPKLWNLNLVYGRMSKK